MRTRLLALSLLTGLAAWTSPASGTAPSGLSLVPTSDFNVTASGFTVECWINVRSRPGMDPRIVRASNAPVGQIDGVNPDVWDLSICDRSNCTRGALYFGILHGTSRFELGSGVRADSAGFHHVAATYDGAVLRVFVDGIQRNELAIGAVTVNVAGGALVVGNATALNNQFDGWIDELRIWNVARTAAEIAASRSLVLAPSTPGLVAYWRFEGTGRDLVAARELDCHGSVTNSDSMALGAGSVSIFGPPGPGPCDRTQCSDGLDNDGNGCIDFPCDGGCASASDSSESGATCVSFPAPGSFTASTDGRCEVVLNWNDVAGETGYKVFRDGVLYAALGADVTTCSVRQEPGAVHQFCVAACDSCHQGPNACAQGSSIGPPAFLADNGNYYEPVPFPLSWPLARIAATTYRFLGTAGHLATVTSAAENGFLAHLAGANYWLGGSQPPGAPAADVGWTWVTGEQWVYANWANGEPNNSNNVDENYLEFIDSNGKWNDVASNDPNTGYVVEYDIAEPLGAPGGLTATSTDCDGVILTWSAAGGAASYRVWRDGILVKQAAASELAWRDVPGDRIAHFYCVAAANTCGITSPTACAWGARRAGCVPLRGEPSDGADLPVLRPLRLSRSASPAVAVDMPAVRWARVEVYDLLGSRVGTLADRLFPMGTTVLTWDRRTAAGGLAHPGIYFARLRSGTVRATARLVCLP